MNARCVHLVTLLSCATAPTLGQWWAPVGGGFLYPGHPRTIHADEVTGELWVGGSFPYALNGWDSVTVVGMAAWNGALGDSIAHRVEIFTGPPGNVCQNTLSFQRVDGALYANGHRSFFTPDSIVNRGIARLNENSMRWEALECTVPLLSGIQQMINAAGDTLFITGYADPLCGLTSSSVYSYYNGDIQRWAPFDDWPYHPDNYVGYVFPFQGQYYMTGLLNDTLGGYYGFLRYTGTAWEPVPGFEVYGPIKKVLIHNNKLYVGGYFWKANGQPGNAIACFDGVSWDDLGGGMHYAPYAPPTPNGSVVDMFFDGDTLYAMGQFQHAGGIPANNIAKWNGVQWCSLPGVFDHYGTFRATKWNGHLYVVGGFYSVDGVVAHQIARYLGGSYVEDCSAPVGIPELTTARLSAHPNPFTTQTRVRCSEVIPSDQVVEVVDINGRVLRSFRGNGSHEALITRDGLAAGLYVLRLMHQGRHLSSVRVVAE